MRVHNSKEAFKKIEKKFVEEQGLPFEEVINREEIEKIVEEEGIKYRSRIFSPAVTLWALLSQVLSDNCSCERTAGKVRSFFIKNKKPVKSVGASAYCQARERLSETLISKLVTKVAKETSKELPEERLWNGRKVAIVDGSNCNAPDTEENQREYPQVESQKPGCGFPFIRIAVAFCWATGMVLEAHFSPLSVSERVLFRFLYERLERGTIILGDRGCCSYCDAFWLTYIYQHDFVFRLHGKKNIDLNTSVWTVKHEGIENWKRPRNTPRWSDGVLVADNITVRAIYYRVDTPGFRSKEVTIVTSLLDFQTYSFDDIASLYFSRWRAETNLRTLKTTMKMEKLKGKTPEIVRKEIWAYFLAYNLIRRLIFQSALLYDKSIFSISFRNTQDSILVFLEQMRSSSRSLRSFLLLSLLFDISKKLLPQRKLPRVEPRRIKQRMKRFSLLTQPRSYYRELLLQGISVDRP